ncbi:YhaI family protein [Anoxybacteroides tepidamans]|uniref:YhaI family protein n=1 Tax=Anoxybacteroides tepidamans TaxID=265948 RepID=UPI000551AEC3|nr:YhaI family protein [Anoxybacillus tepidamans]
MEERIAKLEYHRSLLLEMVDEENKPFHYLVIASDLTKEEVEEVIALCEKLSEEYEKQKAEGLTIFTPLLLHFAGMLNPRLPLEKTVDALLKQQMFTPLMKEFKKLIKTIHSS